MGLFSATAIVMGSMIGSGIFIVSADMSRTLGSPALLIAAWLVTAAMTIIGALSYGELAAMMPKAGGQYVYLRESLGPVWGFLYGWTLFLVIQTGTIAAVGVAFGKFLGVFLPVHQPRPIGCCTFQNTNIGLSTANLAAIAIITLAHVYEHPRRQDSARPSRTSSPAAKVLALLGVVFVGLIAKNALAVGQNFGRRLAKLLGRRGLSTRCTPWTSAASSAWVAVAPRSGRRLHRGRRRSGRLAMFSSDAWNNVTFTAGEIQNPKPQSTFVVGTRNRRCAPALHFLQLRLPQRASDVRYRDRRDRNRPGHHVRRARPRRHRRHGNRPFGSDRCQTHGRRHPDFHVRLRQRHGPRRRRASTMR